MPEEKTLKHSELEPNSVKQFYLEDDTAIAIYNLGGEYFATSDVCTHGQAYLSEGELRGDEIVCPFHAGTFDVRTGEPVDPPCVVPLEKYETRLGEDGYIYVSVA
ncbi:MAG: non-heme iron oxygenase ferredoxin subunit [Gammaproteobacteria bacterium]|nr:non-heme iron oxygenase ferredoxin subunit [Gammaproteobacteria bacterium]